MTDSPKVLTAEEALKLAREIAMRECPCGMRICEHAQYLAQALIERLEPVKIHTPIGFRSFRCKCGEFPTESCRFCPNCGKVIQWA